MSPVYPLLASKVYEALSYAFASPIEVDKDIVSIPGIPFQIGRDTRLAPVAISHAVLVRKHLGFRGVVAHVGDSGGVRLSSVDDDAPPSRPPNGRQRVVTVFHEGDTIASFIADKPQQTFFLGINPANNLLEAHDVAVTAKVPEFCRVRLETQKVGQRPVFSFWDPELVSEAEGWVSFRMKDWDFSKNSKRKPEFVIKSLFSFTLSVMMGRESMVADVHLPKVWRQRVEQLYSVYREYLKAGCLPYFEEMLRLGEWRDGKLQHYVAIKQGEIRRYEESLADFAERIAVTMGLDKFILSISGDGILTAIQNVSSFPHRGAWNFLLTQVSKGAFTVARQTSGGGWEPINPRLYDSKSNILAILVGPEFEYDRLASLGLDHAEINTPERRNQVSLLLTLAARGVDFADLCEVIAARPDSIEDYVVSLLEFSVAHPHYMDFLSRVPNLDEGQPEIRFLSAVDQIYTTLFARLLHQPTDTVLGTYGHYYLRYALRIYVAERVQRDFASFVIRGETPVADLLNLFSSQLLELRGGIATNRNVQKELSHIPISGFMSLAASYKDQAEFVAGTPARDNFTMQARAIARRALYPAESEDELLN